MFYLRDGWFLGLISLVFTMKHFKRSLSGLHPPSWLFLPYLPACHRKALPISFFSVWAFPINLHRKVNIGLKSSQLSVPWFHGPFMATILEDICWGLYLLTLPSPNFVKRVTCMSSAVSVPAALNALLLYKTDILYSSFPRFTSPAIILLILFFWRLLFCFHFFRSKEPLFVYDFIRFKFNIS